MNDDFHVERVFSIKEKYQKELMSKANVVGVGVGYRQQGGIYTDEVALVVFVRTKLPMQQLAYEDVVPSQLDGYGVDVLEVGDVRPFNDRTIVWRPAPGGVSIGHYLITAGTFGSVVRDRNTHELLILSNNHVLANSNYGDVGDSILQPGPYDGGSTMYHVIAHLARFVPIEFSITLPTCNLSKAYVAVGNFIARLLGSSHRFDVIKQQEVVNYVDAAVAYPTDDDIVSDEILEIGTVLGAIPAELGMSVHKSGRTTGYTSGFITALHADIAVNYGEGRTAMFSDQILTGPISMPGDSGSLLVAKDEPYAVGLLFAGSDDITVYNPIQYVISALEIYFGSDDLELFADAFECAGANEV